MSDIYDDLRTAIGRCDEDGAMSETTMTPVERLRAAETWLREAHAATVEKPEPSGLDLDALRLADFGVIFIDPDVALAMADWLDRLLADFDADNYDLDEAISALKVADAILGGVG